MKRLWPLVALVLLSPLSGYGEETLPQGIIPVPAEPGITVTLATDKDTYAPGEYLTVRFTLSQEAYVYLYDVRPDGTVELLIPNRFLQEPRFPAGEHTLPTEGWRLKVTEPEGVEYLELIATDRPLPFYEAKAFEDRPFLVFTDPNAFAGKLRELLVGAWGAAWTSFRVHSPVATIHLDSDPRGAEVWLGGKALGTTPLSAVVPAGHVELRLSYPDYREKEITLELADSEELSAFVKLEPLPTPSQLSMQNLVPLSLGASLGQDSFGVEIWGEAIGLGVAVRPEAGVSATEPGPGGWHPWGPEIEFYGVGWGKISRQIRAVVMVGIALREMAWLPEWNPQAVLFPKVEIEPKIELKHRPTFGLGLGFTGTELRLYLAWHSTRGLILGLVLGRQSKPSGR